MNEIKYLLDRYKEIRLYQKTLSLPKILMHLKNIFGKSSIGSFSISLTDRCNKHCSWCYNGQWLNTPREELKISIYRKLFSQMASINTSKVILVGGEPLMRDDICSIVKEASRNGLLTELSTNGYLLNPSLIKNLEEAGLDCLVISCNLTSDKEVEDIKKIVAKMGNPKFAVNINGLVDFDFSINYYRSNIRTLKNAGISKVRTNAVIDTTFPINSFSRFKKDYQQKNFCNEWRELARHTSHACEALKGNTLCIDTVGRVTLCPCVPLIMGNALTEKLRDIVKRVRLHPITMTDNHNCLFNNLSTWKWIKKIENKCQGILSYEDGVPEPLTGTYENDLHNCIRLLNSPGKMPSRENIVDGSSFTRAFSASPGTSLICRKIIKKGDFHIKAGFNPRCLEKKPDPVDFSILIFPEKTKLSSIQTMMNEFDIYNSQALQKDFAPKIFTYRLNSNSDKKALKLISIPLTEPGHILLHTSSEFSPDYAWSIWAEPHFTSNSKY